MFLMALSRSLVTWFGIGSDFSLGSTKQGCCAWQAVATTGYVELVPKQGKRAIALMCLDQIKNGNKIC